MKRKVRPNVVSGGTAINLGDNLYYMRGKTHKQGGIDIGSNPKTGIEVENGEVIQTSPKGLRVFSAQPILNGISPANALLMGGNPNNIFNAQEAWKQANHYNDDGTKFEGGGYTPSQEIIDYIKKTEGFRDKWYKDGNGIDTIGYGFTGDNVKKLFADGITREQADKYFLETLNRRAKILERDTPNWNKLTQSQKDSLLSYAYNIGPGNYKRSKKLQEALLNEDWDNVANNISIGYNDKRNPGLRKRRDYERELFKRNIKSSFTGDEEKAFRDWYDRYSRYQNLDPNPDAKEHYYDYRTYWKNRTEQQKNDEWKLGNHLPDTYKMPGHPTFSTESIYSTRKTSGGTWKQVGLGPVYDEQFVDSKYTRRLKTYQNVSFALGGDKETINIPNIQYRKLEKRWKKLVNSVAEKIGISEKDVENYFNSGRLNPAIGAYYSVENGGRVRRNDSPTADESEKFNDRVNKTIYGNVKKTSAIPQTGKPNMKYGIPYLIDKEIKIDGVGRMPTNALDSLAKYASITGISLQEALGLAGQETKGGANPYGNTNGTKEENRALLNGNYFREFGFIPAEYLVRDFEYNREEHSVDRNIPPLQHAFQYYKAGKYNSNDKSHSTDVLNTGRIMLNDKDVKNWINSSEYTKNLRINKKYGGIHIKPSKRGTFTAAAKRHHMSVQEFARTVLNNRARYSAAMVKKANFARNASKWHKKELGGDMTKQYYITKDNIYSLGGNVRPKAQLGTKYVVDKYGRIVPVNIPNTDINIANLGEINKLLDPVTVTDSAPKTPSITGRAEIIPQINQSILAPNSHVIQRRLPVSIQDIVNPITSPRDSALNKPDFNSTMLAAFPNPDFDGTVGSIKEKSLTGVTPRNPYYSKLNVGLHKIGNYIKNNPDLIGLGVNLTGNLAASLINRSAIKGMRYGDAPIPISAQKLPTEVTIEPQVSSIKENVAGQERLIADNTADSRVALARRQRVRNQGVQQYQTLFGNKLNTELQLLTADRLNRQGVDAQNVGQYNQWRRGLYDFENRRREMLAENAVSGINNAAEAIAGERGYLARREARKQDARNRALIALTSPNAQKVFDANPGLYEELIRKMSKYGGNFNLLTKRLKK